MASIVSAVKAQRLLDDDPLGRGLITDLAHTVVVQAEQIAAVLAIHCKVTEKRSTVCDGCDEPWPCETNRALGVTA